VSGLAGGQSLLRNHRQTSDTPPPASSKSFVLVNRFDPGVATETALSIDIEWPWNNRLITDGSTETSRERRDTAVRGRPPRPPSLAEVGTVPKRAPVGHVREDYSSHGDAWYFQPHDHARSRAYRWGEDGLAGVRDDEQRLCLALALYAGALTHARTRGRREPPTSALGRPTVRPWPPTTATE
jgi:hypothetical protein